MMNKKGGIHLDKVFSKNLNPLSYSEIKKLWNTDVILLDTRPPEVFATGFVKGSINIGLDGQYAPWVGALIDSGKSLLLICDREREKESVMRLARVGYENVVGYLDGGISAWQDKLTTIKNMSSEDIASTIKEQGHQVLDVRKPGEVENGHLIGSTSIRLQQLAVSLNSLDNSQPIIVYCAGGYRSMMACSILSSNGFEEIINIKDGFDGLKNQDVPLSDCITSCNN
jgi:hydroxyacylglutathione hydrolase